MDEKKLEHMSDDALDEVAGGEVNYDFYGNPINNGGTVPATPVSPVGPGFVDNGLNISIVNGRGATYVCPGCGGRNFRIVSANSQNINLRCKNCGTNFTVANV